MKYSVHMISLKLEGSSGHSVVFSKGENMVDGHLAAVKDWVRRMELQPDEFDGSDLV